MTTQLVYALVGLATIASYAPVYAAPDTSPERSRADAPSTGRDALRFAKQAEAAGIGRDRDGFVKETDRALQAALDAGARTPSHRLAESVHALMEALALGRQGNLAAAREDLQSAMAWLSRATGAPDDNRETSSLPKERSMDHFLTDIEQAAASNEHFRKVLFTAEHSQLVLMSLKPGEEIGMEIHHLDQFIRIEAGQGTAQLNGKDYPIQDGSAVVIPAGTKHNIVNSGKQGALKLYTIYSPPEHKDGTVHRTKQEAEADRDDHFDGKTTAMLQQSAP
jgi:mannose-6-phosphate isomerase-like protein (cupin superfamily)